MILRACLEEQVGRLVHPGARASASLAARHAQFIETRLAVSFGGLSLIPVCLVDGMVPGWADALVLAWLLLPLVAVALLSARGRLEEAEAVSAVTWIGLAFSLVLGHLAGVGTAAMLLALPLLEATLGANSRTLARAGTAAMASLLVLGFVAQPGRGAEGLANPFFMLLAAGYGLLLCRLAARGGPVTGSRDEGGLAQLRALVDTCGDLMIRFDHDGARPVNAPAARALFGVEGSALVGRGLFERVHVADRPLFLKLVSDGSRSDGEVDGVFRLRVSPDPDGDRPAAPVFRSVAMRVRALPSTGPDAPAVRFAALAVLRPAAEPAVPTPLPAAKDEDGEWRDRFLATVSHELRTPLNAIIGFSEMLASDALLPRRPEKQREYAEIIQTSGHHLLAIVNSMLDLSKIDAGKFDLRPEPFDVAGLLASCCDMVRLKAEQARVDLRWTVRPDAPVMVGDQRACRQIVLNLLSNALKFTPEFGRATVEAAVEGDTLSLVVTDTGIGMMAPDLARLGDPFFQAHSAYDRRFDGTGLGLSVVSGLVGLHGGTIVAESAPGQGTRITVRLPRHGGEPCHNRKAKIVTIPRAPHRTAGVPQTPAEKVKRIA